MTFSEESPFHVLVTSYQLVRFPIFLRSHTILLSSSELRVMDWGEDDKVEMADNLGGAR
jgi:hypothetical protein